MTQNDERDTQTPTYIQNDSLVTPVSSAAGSTPSGEIAQMPHTPRNPSMSHPTSFQNVLETPMSNNALQSPTPTPRSRRTSEVERLQMDNPFPERRRSLRLQDQEIRRLQKQVDDLLAKEEQSHSRRGSQAAEKPTPTRKPVKQSGAKKGNKGKKLTVAPPEETSDSELSEEEDEDDQGEESCVEGEITATPTHISEQIDGLLRCGVDVARSWVGFLGTNTMTRNSKTREAVRAMNREKKNALTMFKGTLSMDINGAECQGKKRKGKCSGNGQAGVGKKGRCG